MSDTTPKREFAATVYIVRGEKVLLIFHKGINKFIPIGGHVEENETPDETAVREAKEETGFNIELIGKKENGDLISSETNRRELTKNISIGLDIINPEHHHINLAYYAKIIDGEQLEISDEGTELRWFNSEELPASQEVPENVRQEALKAIELFQNNNT